MREGQHRSIQLRDAHELFINQYTRGPIVLPSSSAGTLAYIIYIIYFSSTFQS